MDEGLLAKAVEALAASTKALADAEERWTRVREEESSRDAERSERFHKDGVRLNEEAQKINQQNNEILRFLGNILEKQIAVNNETLNHNKALHAEQLEREEKDKEWLALKRESDMVQFKEDIEFRKEMEERKAKDAAEK